MRLVARVAEKIYKDQDAKIEEFISVFRGLRENLNGAILHQNLVFTSRVLEDADTLGMNTSLSVHHQLTSTLSSNKATRSCSNAPCASYVMFAWYPKHDYQ